MAKERIKVAIAGVGNCASSLIQGIYYYGETNDTVGLMHPDLGGYGPGDIDIVAAFDVDERKVGKPLEEAIFAPPNCTMVFWDKIPKTGVVVKMGPIFDGISPHMMEYPEEISFRPAKQEPVDVVEELKKSGAEVLVNYMPVGSEQAARFYAEAALEAGVAFINAMPTFIVSDSQWAKKFEEKGIPAIGDDVKSQVGATIVHRVLTKLFEDRGVKITRTYQTNFGGNTDFLNMLERKRLATKRVSKTEAVRSMMKDKLDDYHIYVGPSDFIPWLKDNKICYIRMEGEGFGHHPIIIDLKLSVEDSPNSGGIIIDAIRAAKIALERGVAGPLLSISAYTMKHPPVQYTDWEARKMVEEFIRGERER